MCTFALSVCVIKQDGRSAGRAIQHSRRADQRPEVFSTCGRTTGKNVQQIHVATRMQTVLYVSAATEVNSVRCLATRGSRRSCRVFGGD